MARLHGAKREHVPSEFAPGRKGDPAPGQATRTDAQDLLYAGCKATAGSAVMRDVDGTSSLAVTLDDDPAAELAEWYGRYHYYRLDEVLERAP